jgi:hypothetical protein
LEGAFGGKDLADHFSRLEVTFPAQKTTCAELAAIGAADLGRDAESVAVGGLSVQGGIGGDQDAFDEGMIVEAPEEFDGGVGRALLADELERMKGVVTLELFAEGSREVRHGVPRDDVTEVDPFEDLGGAIGGLAPAGESGFEIRAGEGLGVVGANRHWWLGWQMVRK